MSSTIKIAIAVSLTVHLVLLGLIGSTSAAKPIDVEQLKVVRVDLVKTPDQLTISKPDQPKPQEAPKPEPDTYVPPVQQMKTDARPPKPAAQPRTKQSSKPVHVASAKLPGDPGGALNIGTQSEHGQDLGQVENGNTPVGWVPSPTGGQGAGSGTGAGVGRPDPVPDASPGPGHEPAPPPPKMVEVTVCEISGERPNKYCEKKVTRSFVDGREPSGTCDKCKPEPKYESRLADAKEAERIKDAPVDIPEAVRETGIDARVTITYTVDTDGSVKDVEVIASSDNPAVDRAVIAAARKMKYRPAMQDGVTRSVKMRRTYRIHS